MGGGKTFVDHITSLFSGFDEQERVKESVLPTQPNPTAHAQLKQEAATTKDGGVPSAEYDMTQILRDCYVWVISDAVIHMLIYTAMDLLFGVLDSSRVPRHGNSMVLLRNQACFL